MALDMQNKLIHKSINEQFLMSASSMWFKWNSQTTKKKTRMEKLWNSVKQGKWFSIQRHITLSRCISSRQGNDFFFFFFNLKINKRYYINDRASLHYGWSGNPVYFFRSQHISFFLLKMCCRKCFLVGTERKKKYV